MSSHRKAMYGGSSQKSSLRHTRETIYSSVSSQNARSSRKGLKRKINDCLGSVSDRFIPKRQFLSSSKTANLAYEIGYQHSQSRKKNKRQTASAKTYDEKLKNSILENASGLKVFQFNERDRNKKTSLKLSATRPPNPCQYKISTAPLRVLDAPQVLDDFYSNHMDWSCRNVVVVALSESVYLWNSADSEIHLIRDEGPQVLSVKFSPCGHYVAVGYESENDLVDLYNVGTQQVVRSINGHTGKVAATCWHGHLLAVGSSAGVIQLHDVRKAQSLVSKLIGHGQNQEICGLAFNNDGHYLASGANDNNVCVWEKPGQKQVDTNPYAKFCGHKAAVKALAWCPWQYGHLATGGGSEDKTVKIWNLRTKECLHSVDVNNQVVGVHWNPWERQIVTAHGYPDNTVKLWSYPHFKELATLEGHSSRIVHTCSNGEYLVSLGADETMKFWKIFNAPKEKPKEILQMSGFPVSLR